MHLTEERSQRELCPLDPTPLAWLEAIRWTGALEAAGLDIETGPAAHAANPEIRAARRRLRHN